MGTLRHLLALLLPSVLAALPTLAAAPATTTATTPSTTQATSHPSAARLDELVHRLSSDDFKERQTAQQELSALGEDVLPALRTARDSATDPEARGRLDAIVRGIERNSVDVATRVSLHLHDANPREGFDALARQSGYAMALWPPNLWKDNNGMPKANVTADLADVTYWTAMRALAAQSNVHLQSMGGFAGHPTIMQGNNEWAAAPEVEVGPFLVVVTDVTRHHVADLSKGKEVHRDLHVSVVVLPEPKVRVLQADHQLAVQAIEDETGAPLLPDGKRQIPATADLDQPSPFAQYPYNYQVQLDSWRSPIGQRVATFKGSARFRIQARVGQIVFPDAVNAKNATQTVTGHRAVLQSCTGQGSAFQAQLTLYRDALSEQEWRLFERAAHDVQLVTADGTVYRMEGGGGGGSDKESHWSAYLVNEEARFGGGPAGPRPAAAGPAKLVLPFPLEVKTVTVPFEFHDLPIP